MGIIVLRGGVDRGRRLGSGGQGGDRVLNAAEEGRASSAIIQTIGVGGLELPLDAAYHGKIERCGLPSQVKVALRILRETVDLIRSAAADGGGKNQRRIDDERFAAIVIGNREPKLSIATRFVAPIHGNALAGAVLIENRLALDQRSSSGGKLNLAAIVEPDTARSVKGESVKGKNDARGIGAGCDDEIVFQLAVFAVVDGVDARINVALQNAFVSCNVRELLPGPTEIIHHTRQRASPFELGGIRIDKSDSNALREHGAGAG
jgi:hypothetical protein